jgi:Ca2+:H+ antiporter
LTALFTGVILVPIVGNAAEHATAVTVAMKNKMDSFPFGSRGIKYADALFVRPRVGDSRCGYVGKPMDVIPPLN